MARLYSRAKHPLAALFVCAKGHVTLTVTGRNLHCFAGQRLPKRPKYATKVWPMRQQSKS